MGEIETIYKEERKASPARYIILLLGVLSTFGPLSVDMYIPSLPEIEKTFSSSTSLVQMTITGCLIGLAFGQIVVGPLSDIYGRRKPLIIAVSIYACTSIICVFTSSIWLLVILRLVQGLSGSAGTVIAQASVRDLYSGPKMTRMLSTLVLVMGLAPILAPLLGGFILTFVSWRGVFWALFIIGVAILIVTIFLFPETLHNENRSTGGLRHILKTMKGLGSHRLFMGHALTVGFANGAMFAYIAGSSFVLQVIFHVSPQVYSLFFGVNALGLIMCSQISGRWAGRVDENQFLKIGLSLQIVGSLLLLIFSFFTIGMFPIVIGFFCVVSSIGFITPNGNALAMKSQHGNAGSVSALLGLIRFGFGGLLAPLAGVSGSHTAIPMAALMLFCSLSAVIVHLLMIKNSPSSVYE